MPKTLLVFSKKGVSDKDRENLVTQVQMVADAMGVPIEVMDTHQKLKDTKQETIAKAVFDLLGLREIDPTLLDEHRINMDLDALRSQGFFESNYCVVLTGKIDYITGHHPADFVAHDNVCFIKSLDSHTVMAMINEIFVRMEIS